MDQGPDQHPCHRGQSLRDVWHLFHNQCLYIRQLLSCIPPEAAPSNFALIIVLGSPCQDFTTIGHTGGYLGLCGNNSRHLLALYALLRVLDTANPLLSRCVILENAGSMKTFHKDFLITLFGIPPNSVHLIDGATFGQVERKRNFFTRYSFYATPAIRPHPWFLGWRPVGELFSGIKAYVRAAKPWTKPRDFTDAHGLGLSSFHYLPQHLLYHVPSFGGTRAFQSLCAQAVEDPDAAPDVNFCLPPGRTPPGSLPGAVRPGSCA